VASGRWMGSRGPIGGGLLRPLERGLMCLKGAGWQSGDPVCLWIAGLAGFRGRFSETVLGCASLKAWPSGDCECLWLTACQALGLWPGRAGILQAYAGLRGVSRWSGYCAGLCRPGGMAGWSRDSACVDAWLGRP
jgi:hypothetical protein